MLDEQIRLVTESWPPLVAHGSELADEFYGRLFRLDPGLRALFPADLSSQKQKLLDMLNLAVLSLHALEDLLPSVRTLGARHASYGVEPDHYGAVGSALLMSLEVCAGKSWNTPLEIAWAQVYELLSATMIGAAESARRPKR